jgi:hypothetical protein
MREKEERRVKGWCRSNFQVSPRVPRGEPSNTTKSTALRSKSPAVYNAAIIYSGLVK